MKLEAFKWSKGDHSLILCEGCAFSHPSREHGDTRKALPNERVPRCQMCGAELKEPAMGKLEQIKALPHYREPVPGEDVCVGSSYYLSHGADDFDGGMCQIGRVIRKEIPENPINELMVTIVERPGHQYNWYLLMEKEPKNRELYGDRRGRPNPDLDPQFNEG